MSMNADWWASRYPELVDDAIHLAKDVIAQNGSFLTHISGNGPTIDEVIERALRVAHGEQRDLLLKLQIQLKGA